MSAWSWYVSIEWLEATFWVKYGLLFFAVPKYLGPECVYVERLINKRRFVILLVVRKG